MHKLYDFRALSATEFNDYLVEDENGVLNFPQHTVMLKTWFSLRNLNIHKHLCRVMAGEEDESTLNAEESQYYADIQKYLDGDLIGYGGMKTFGNDMSAMSVIDYYYENDAFEFNEFTTGTTKTMGQKMSTITDKIYEYYTKVIMGIESTDNFDSFVKEVNSLGLDTITDEVNEWYHGRE